MTHTRAGACAFRRRGYRAAITIVWLQRFVSGAPTTPGPRVGCVVPTGRSPVGSRHTHNHGGGEGEIVSPLSLSLSLLFSASAYHRGITDQGSERIDRLDLSASTPRQNKASHALVGRCCFPPPCALCDRGFPPRRTQAHTPTFSVLLMSQKACVLRAARAGTDTSSRTPRGRCVR